MWETVASASFSSEIAESSSVQPPSPTFLPPAFLQPHLRLASSLQRLLVEPSLAHSPHRRSWLPRSWPHSASSRSSWPSLEQHQTLSLSPYRRGHFDSKFAAAPRSPLAPPSLPDTASTPASPPDAPATTTFMGGGVELPILIVFICTYPKESPV